MEWLRRGLPVVLSSRTMVLIFVAVEALGILGRVLPDDQAFTAAMRLGLSTGAIGVAPGALLVLLVWPRRSVRLLELLGLGITLSFALVGLLAALAILLHGSANQALMSLLLLSVGLAVVAAWRPASLQRVWIGPAELTIGMLLLLVAAILYIDGSPPFAGEDQIHISVIRRLAALPSLSLDNFYIAPGVIYTYPIPGTHFFFSLISNLSDIDPLFVYQKLRFFWGVSSILSLYLAARLLLSSEVAASAVALIGVLFGLTGSFATVNGYFWGQLFPYSHASDVAMNVLLPGLMVLTFYFLHARGVRGSITLFTLTLPSVLLLTFAHSREIVELLVYLGSFTLAVVVLRLRGKWRYAIKAAALAAVTILVVAGYSNWQRSAAGSVDVLEATRKHAMQDLMAALSPFSGGSFRIPWDLWIHAPLSAHNENPGALAYGWNPIGLALGPLLLLALRRNVTLLLVGASVVAYLLIIRVLVLSATFEYFTYSEVLSTPVRNVVFFVYLAVGAGLYVAAVALVRIGRRWVGVAIALASSLLIGWIVYPWSAAFVQTHSDVVFLGVPLAYALAFLVYHSRLAVRASNRLLSRRLEPKGWVLPYVALVVPLAIATRVPDSAPLGLTTLNPRSLDQNIRSKLQMTPSGMIDQLQCCAPTSVFIGWAHQNLPLDAVVAWNALNPYLLTTFLPQQIPAPTGSAGPAVFLEYVTPTYYALAEHAKQEGHSQPFFDPTESPAERLEYLQRLHITHVVLDPATYDAMRPVLLQDPATFQPLYDDGRWAAFTVQRP